MAADAPSPKRRRIPPLVRALVIAFAVVAASLVVTAAPAQAENTGQSVTALENEINAQWQSLEPTIESYDAVNAQYLAQLARANQLEAQIEPLAVKVAVAQARVGSMSAQLYEAGPTGGLALMLDTTTATNTLDMLATVNQMAVDRQREISATIKLRDQYEAQKAPIDALVTSLNAQRQSLAAQKRTIDQQIKSLDALRIKAWGSTVAPGATEPVACPQVYTGDRGSRAAAVACGKIGKRYVWDAAGPNTFDCSGLTMYSWGKVGVSLPHNAYAQKHSMPGVSFANLRPGDLIFYYSNIQHVAMYVGKGWMVNAPNSGDVVRMAKYNRYPVNSFGRP